jgi:arginine-tRNA-protein transferase
MLVQTASIFGLKRAEYDDLLARGWFRGNGIVYRSEVVCIDSKVYGIRNIRFPVGAFSMRRSHRKLYAKNNKSFTIRIGTPQCDAPREALYQGLKPRFKAFVHDTLEGVLLSPRLGAEFDAMEIAVYDGDQLAAVSYVDIGDRSMASILCIYDQKYKKESLGIYTMLVEMNLAKRLGLDYYYPGYVLDEPSAFDYKLELGPCEWLNQEDFWCTSSEMTAATKASRIRLRMEEARGKLHDAGFQTTLKIYPFYTLGHLLLERPDLIRVPSYLTIETEAGVLAVSYDLQMNSFICFDLHSVQDLDFLHSLQLSNDYSSGDNYQLEPRRCTFFHRLRYEFFKEDLTHIIQLMSHATLLAE